MNLHFIEFCIMAAYYMYFRYVGMYYSSVFIFFFYCGVDNVRNVKVFRT